MGCVESMDQSARLYNTLTNCYKYVHVGYRPVDKIWTFGLTNFTLNVAKMDTEPGCLKYHSQLFCLFVL